MNNQRPVNLNLLTIKFPVHAIASILHRVSGVIIFFLIPIMLWVLQKSFVSPAFYVGMQTTLTTLCGKLFVFVFLGALLFHLVTGIRHLLMDMGVGETLPAGRYTSWIAFGCAAILILALGIWLW